jgi:hypothetical protein
VRKEGNETKQKSSTREAENNNMHQEIAKETPKSMRNNNNDWYQEKK